MYKKISDYGIIGNLRSIALVGSDGSIDWLCLPHLDSPSIFGALLDDEKGGRFALAPVDPEDATSAYIPGTNILRTRFRTRTGEMELVDFMTIRGGANGRRGSGECELYRRLTIRRGAMAVGMVFDPRFDYGRGATSLRREKHLIAVTDGAATLTLAVSGEIPAGDALYTARWSLEEGQTLWFRLKYNCPEAFACDPQAAEEALADSREYWRNWLEKRETGRCVRLGHYQPMVDRSALLLKLLQFEETGPIAAAATTSLPEEIGGARNWDYRYTWVRDTTFTLDALFDLGHLSEIENYLKWIERLLSNRDSAGLKVMYGLRGEEELPEFELAHLDGYKGSRPVRIGNRAAEQRQLDIYGEIMDSALKLSGYAGKIDYGIWPLLRGLCDDVVSHWREKDQGIWEMRCDARHFTYSKVMCWVALDRGITIARRYGFPADLETWERERAAIRAEVLEKGWSREKGAFVQHYDAEDLDASNLLIPLFGFLPFEDPRIVSTIEAVARELSRDGFLCRYLGGDGLPGREAPFLVCSFWLVDCLAGLGRLDEAEFLLRSLETRANHLGLFSEEYDVRWQESLGNFPQAFTHIGYINSVVRLLEARKKARGKPEAEAPRLSLLQRLLPAEILLNGGEARRTVPAEEIASRLKNTMNILRGAFFETAPSRVAYEKMKDSDVYREYLALSYSLQGMQLESIAGRKGKLAFWINIYNVLVIHAVIELGIRDSVKEVRGFFKRIGYRIDEMFFTPQAIEHGILRANRRPPYALTPVFAKGDPRLVQTIEPLDPRIHFALVCASSSCPPIDVYTAENLDEELEISGRTFLNAGGAVIHRDTRQVCLSRIFKWYARDFGKTPGDCLRFIAPYLYRQEDRGFIEENADRLRVTYQDYDWRLNRI